MVSSNGPYDAFGCIAYLPATHTLAPKISNEDLHPKLIENMKSQPYEEVPPKFNLKSVRDIALSLCLELYERHPGDESLYLCLFDIYTIKGSDLKIPSPFAGKKDNEAAVSMFLCYMAKVTNNFEYGAIDAALKKGWYRKRITVLIETLKRLNNFVAVAVLYQIELPINYQEAFSAIRSAAPMKQITKETSPFFWESSIVEYAQYQCFHTPGCKDIVLKAEKRIETPQGGRQKMLEKTMPNVSKFFKWLILQ
ncbi:hypothetical protein H4219_003205 [Mycoemilia scoparia]|uniref:Uncharacterized protein n=1 Tax=Mycoemilia scoparia TaxID=417184 RepID=A0A9W8A4V8_9FUNG|nr:hypothetical protein H4219_003205 [Mycoemilia scoparia]